MLWAPPHLQCLLSKSVVLLKRASPPTAAAAKQNIDAEMYRACSLVSRYRQLRWQLGGTRLRQGATKKKPMSKVSSKDQAVRCSMMLMLKGVHLILLDWQALSTLVGPLLRKRSYAAHQARLRTHHQPQACAAYLSLPHHLRVLPRMRLSSHSPFLDHLRGAPCRQRSLMAVCRLHHLHYREANREVARKVKARLS
jgi:hypothetical protein